VTRDSYLGKEACYQL